MFTNVVHVLTINARDPAAPPWTMARAQYAPHRCGVMRTGEAGYGTQTLAGHNSPSELNLAVGSDRYCHQPNGSGQPSKLH